MTRTIMIITIGMIMRIGRIGGIWRRGVTNIGSIRNRVSGGGGRIGSGGTRIRTERGGSWKDEIGGWDRAACLAPLDFFRGLEARLGR